MTVAFIGSNDFKRAVPTTVKMWNELTKLVTDEGADVFLFTNEGLFDNSCWQVVTQLQTQHPNIKRIYAQTGYEDNRGELQELEKCYEEIILLNSLCENKVLAPFARNRFMVLMSDVLVTYFDDTNLRMPRIASSTEEAIQFANRYKKRIINLCKLKYTF